MLKLPETVSIVQKTIDVKCFKKNKLLFNFSNFFGFGVSSLRLTHTKSVCNSCQDSITFLKHDLYLATILDSVNCSS